MNILISYLIVVEDGFKESCLLNFYHSDCRKMYDSLITVVVWHIWKSQCNMMFKGFQPDFGGLAYMILVQVEEYNAVSKINIRKFLYNSYCSHILTDAP